jgi:hypothetical protein
MSLQALPNELLEQILFSVGADEFRNRVDRLTVFKRWYDIAHTMIIRHTKITQQNVSKFPPPPEQIRVRELLKQDMRKLSIHISATEGSEYRSSLSTTEMQKTYYWHTALNKDLTRIAEFAQTCSRLTDVSFGTSIQWNYWSANCGPEFYSMTQLLLPTRSSHITKLNLDLYGAWIADQASGDEPRRPAGPGYRHICPLVNKHLPTLQKLQIYAYKMCNELLDATEYLGDLQLEEVILKLTSKSPNDRKSSHGTILSEA